MKIERWFQGAYICDGVREGFDGFSEDGTAMAQCLATQAMYDRLTPAQIAQLASIVVRLFPSRTTCERCEFSRISRLIHANNHELTTREDIDKILRIFTEEEQARDAGTL